MTEQVGPIDSGALDWIWDGRLKEKRGYSEETLQTVALILSNPCPHCQAPVGKWCRTTSGKEIDDLDRQHGARRVEHWRRYT